MTVSWIGLWFNQVLDKFFVSVLNFKKIFLDRGTYHNKTFRHYVLGSKSVDLLICQSWNFGFWILRRGWCPKFATGLNIIIRHSSKSIWVTNLLFCQNDSPIRKSFWQKDSLITHILFELWLIMIFSPVPNFGQHPLHTLLIFNDNLTTRT